MFVLCSVLPVPMPDRGNPIGIHSDLTRLGGGCCTRGCLQASGRDFLSDKALQATSFHTSSVDLIKGCSRDNKIPQTL
jgi:hypothetical protein